MPSLSIARANSIILTNRMMNVYYKQRMLQLLKQKKGSTCISCTKIRKHFKK